MLMDNPEDRKDRAREQGASAGSEPLKQSGRPAQSGQPSQSDPPSRQPAKGERGRLFTREELARYDGKEGRPAYVAYGGLVFDVSGSMRWRGGRHQDRHDAGRDLTAEFKEAPHSTTILLRVPIVGRLPR